MANMNIKNIITPPPIYKTIEPLRISHPSILAAKAGDIKIDKDGELLRSFLQYRGMTKTLIDTYNNWITHVLPEQIMSRTVNIDNNYLIRFLRPITLLKPYVEDIKSNNKISLFPNMARENDRNYVSNLQVSFEIENLVDKTRQITENINIGSIPVMVGSVLCHTYGKTDRELEEMGECPCDPQGYYIIKGAEKNILLQENLRANKIFVFMNDSGNAICTFTSSVLTETSIITIELDSYDIMKLNLTMFEKDENQKVRTIPVFLILNIYFDRQDMDIVDYVLQFTRPEWKDKVRRVIMYNMLVASNVTDPAAKLHEVRFKKTERGKESIEDDKRKTKSARQKMYEEIRAKKEEEKEMTEDNILETKKRFLDVLFPHMNQEQPHLKIDLLCMMIIRLAEYACGLRQIDERDDWGNKKLESGGRLMEQLFNGIWKKITDKLREDVKDNLKKSKSKTVDSALIQRSLIKSDIRDDMIESFTPNQWGVRSKDSHNKGYFKANITDYLKRDSLIMTYSHLMRINTPVSRKAKITHIRVVQGSQTGYVCPVETPEGEGCGIVKSMSITTQLSIENSNKTNIVESILRDYISLGKDLTHDFKILFNGRFLGWVDGRTLHPKLIGFRRKGIIERDVSIVLDGKDNTLYIYSDSSRVTRPLLVVENGKVLVDDNDDDGIPLRQKDFEYLLSKGIIEYIDAFEQNTILLAKSTSTVYARQEQLRQHNLKLQEATLMGQDTEGIERAINNISKPFTHCELDPNAIFGVSASLIPFSDRNQAPRNVYQAQMGKQAVGIYHSNYLNRMETTVKALAFPSRPLLETQMNQVIGLTDMPNGQMVTVAFMTYTGYNQEDSIIFNKASIDRGLFWYEKLFRFAAVPKSGNDFREEFMIHPDKIKDGKIIDPEFSKIDISTGLPYIGVYIEKRDVVIPMVRIQNNGSSTIYTDISVRADQRENGYIRRVFKGFNYAGAPVVKVRVSQVRKPIIGDKFASRYAQKGTIGMILPEEDMPFVATENGNYVDVPYTKIVDGKEVTEMKKVKRSSFGMRPDLIINPHSIPSRMTQGKLIEIIGSKLSALKGERINATSFKNFSIDDIREQLGNYGFNHQGYEVMASGFTGKLFGSGYYEEDEEDYELTGQLSAARQQAEIYMGPCFYQMLPHHVIDKITARGVTGGIDPLTHQPCGGCPDGAQRTGEMERDAIISHGATSLLLERFCYSSDMFTNIICLNCGMPAVHENVSNQYTCKKCKEVGKFARLKYSYSTMYLQHMLSALGMDTRFRLKLGGSFIPESRMLKMKQMKEEADEEDEEDEEEEDEAEEIDELMEDININEDYYEF